ncbi:ABC transporter permease [Pyxidicoccus parkwayensis]|uniref:ABC transporter permease n=1 Tax=Pyxidicoccus parkwayensis TaxID=2813578 RepID=A0ABX7P0V8_9BACT|nr:FtsX-like permease family protein [Pyxidicoccus parkwaysis]QSQ21968.1 ABC transporter permease [Pyxidicoccus parkwaysis]
MWTLFTVACRNVLRNRRRTALTLAALIVGVGITVIVHGFVNGMKRGVVNQFISAATGAVQVHHAGYVKNVLSTPLSLDVPADDAFLSRVGHVEGVTGVSPRLQFSGTVSVGDESLFFTALALDPEREHAVCPWRERTLVAGSTFKGDTDLLLAQSLSAAAGVRPGEEAVLLAPDRDGALNAEATKLSGTLMPLGPGEARFGQVSLALAQRLLRMEGRATELAVSVKDFERAPEVAGRLRAELGPDYEVHTWDEVAPLARDAMARLDAMAATVTTVFLILMLLGVANTSLMTVLERTREIGTMMAVGVRRSWIAALFLAESAVVAALGGSGGALIGLAVVSHLGHKGLSIAPGGAKGVVPIEVHPMIPLGELALFVAVAIVGATLFSLYPAWRASRLRPVQALAGN